MDRKAVMTQLLKFSHFRFDVILIIFWYYFDITLHSGTCCVSSWSVIVLHMIPQLPLSSLRNFTNLYTRRVSVEPNGPDVLWTCLHDHCRLSGTLIGDDLQHSRWIQCQRQIGSDATLLLSSKEQPICQYSIIDGTLTAAFPACS
jgi:hypothetical protein